MLPVTNITSIVFKRKDQDSQKKKRYEIWVKIVWSKVQLMRAGKITPQVQNQLKLYSLKVSLVPPWWQKSIVKNNMIPNWHQRTVINIISSTDTDSTLLQNYTVVWPRSISNNQFYSLTRLCKAGERQASKVLYWTHLYFGWSFIWIPFVPDILHTRQQLLCASLQSPQIIIKF